MKKTMRHVLAMMLVCMLMISVIPVNASAAEDNTLVVASTTKMSGNFFTDMWGSNTSDIDVRMLLHGYNLVKWDPEFAAYGVDDSVVDTVVVTQNSKGDRTFHLYLNEDMYYSDGTQITAKDYAFTFLLQSASEMRQIGAAIHTADYIVGLDEYINDKTNEISGIVLEGDKSVSGHHCVIYRVGDDLMLRDNNSSNGTWLNHQKLTNPERIDSGDVIGIGRSRWVG